MATDRRKLQMGFEIGHGFRPEIKKGLDPIDESIAKVNQVIHEKYDPNISLRLVRTRNRKRKRDRA